MTILLILFLGLCRGEIISVEMSFIVPASFNSTNFVEVIAQYNEITSNIKNISNPFSGIQSLIQSLGVFPIICIFGTDLNCFNDTNMTRLNDTSYTPYSSSESSQVNPGIIAGSVIGGLCGISLITISIILCVNKKKQIRKNHIIRVKIEHPDTRKPVDTLYKNRLKTYGRYIYHTHKSLQT